jgi:hypothetical protein
VHFGGDDPPSFPMHPSSLISVSYVHVSCRRMWGGGLTQVQWSAELAEGRFDNGRCGWCSPGPVVVVVLSGLALSWALHLCLSAYFVAGHGMMPALAPSSLCQSYFVYRCTALQLQLLHAACASPTVRVRRLFHQSGSNQCGLSIEPLHGTLICLLAVG